MTLYEIKEEYLMLLNNLEVDEETGEITNMEELEAAQGEFYDKAEAVGCFIKELQAQADALKNEMEKLKARMDAKNKKVESLKGYLAQNLVAMDVKKYETEKLDLSFRKSESVNIVDEFNIPEMYIKTEIKKTPNKTEIKKAIKDGKEVPGAELVEKMNLQIK